MLVALRHAGVRPAHERHDRPLRHAQDKEDGGRGVASVVETGLADARGAEEPFPFVVVGARVDRLTGR